MKSPQTALGVLFPKAQAELLRWLCVHDNAGRYVRELSAVTGLALSTVQHELKKLQTLKLVTSWSNGYRRFYQINQRDHLAMALTRLVVFAEKIPVERALGARGKRRGLRNKRRRRVLPIRADRLSWGIFTRKKT